MEETCLICDDPLSILASTLVPRAIWGPKHEDQEALGTHDLKSKILELPVISESKVSWGILFLKSLNHVNLQSLILGQE